MGFSDKCVFCDISGALLLEKKQSSLVHVGSSVIFVAGTLADSWNRQQMQGCSCAFLETSR